MTTRFLAVSENISPDKLATFKDQVNHYGLSFEIIPVTFGQTKQSGHLIALANFLRSTDDYCVIVDTGVIISCAFKEVINEFLFTVRNRWGVCWLGLTVNHHNNAIRPRPKIYEHNEMLMVVSYPLGYFGYILTREVAGNILQNKDEEPYDIKLMKVCTELKHPLLALKNPIIHYNVWLEDLQTIKLYENVDLALYRRDFELDYMIRYPESKVYVPNLNVGTLMNDLSFKEIKDTVEKFYEQKDEKILNNLRTWKQKIIILANGADEDHYGRNLFYFRHIPTIVYLQGRINISKIPLFPHMSLKLGKPKINSSDLVIKITEFHFIPRDTFNRYWDNIEWVGFITGTKPDYNYFYSGNGENKYYNRNISEQTNSEDLIYHLCRQVEESLVEKDRNKLTELTIKKYIPVDWRKTIAFIGERFDNDYSDYMEISPDEHPDLLISDINCDVPARKHIIFSRRPEEISTKRKVVISAYKDERYLWFPEFLWKNLNEIEVLRKDNNDEKREFFCTLTSLSFNEKEASMLKLLETFKKVESAGKFHSNREEIGAEEEEILKFYKRSNFVLICDDPIIPGLINSKLILAFKAGCIPIYLGPIEVDIFFNPKTYINIHHFKTVEDFLNRIRSIELNNQRREILEETIFTPEVKDYIIRFSKLFTY